MRYDNSHGVSRIHGIGAFPARTTWKWMVPYIFGALALMPQFVHAYSFAGDDWRFNMVGVFHAGIFGDYDVDAMDEPISITQSSMTEITIPINIPDPVNVTITAPATVDGQYIHAVTYVAEIGPIHIEEEEFQGDILLRNINAQLDGDATGINPSDTSGGYGERAYHITGQASPDSYVTADGYMDFGFGWVKVAEAEIEITSWNAERSMYIPEPGTVAMLLGLAASLAGYGLWKRRC